MSEHQRCATVEDSSVRLYWSLVPVSCSLLWLRRGWTRTAFAGIIGPNYAGVKRELALASYEAFREIYIDRGI